MNRLRSALRPFAAAIIATLLIGLTVSPASAKPEGTSIGEGLYFAGATIQGNGPENGRTLDSYQAAVFMQSWFVPSLVQAPNFEVPTPIAVSYQMTIGVDASESGGTLSLGIDPAAAKGSFVVNYATDGTSAWISLPVEAMWPGAFIDAAHADKWFKAEDTSIAAFNGTGILQEVPKAPDLTAKAETAGAQQTTSSSSGSNTGLIIVLLLGTLVALGAIFGSAYVISRRRDSAAGAKSSSRK